MPCEEFKPETFGILVDPGLFSFSFFFREFLENFIATDKHTFKY